MGYVRGMLLVLIDFCSGFGCLVFDVLVLVVLCLVCSVDVGEKECIIDADGGQNHVCCL